MTIAIRVILICTCSVAIGACIDSPLGGGPNTDKCLTGMVVTTGTTPQFRWSSACHVQRVEVSGTGCGPQFFCWQIEAKQTNGIAPSVTYGMVPSSATERTAAVALQAGTGYWVSISRDDPGGPDIVATVEFTP